MWRTPAPPVGDIECLDRVRIVTWQHPTPQHPEVGSVGVVTRIFSPDKHLTVWGLVDIEGRGVVPVRRDEIEKVTE